MKKLASSALALALLAMVSGCGDSAPSENAAVADANDQPMANDMMTDASNPYGSAEMRMHERMTAAVGTDVSDTWVKKMIEHHRGAVEMSNIAIAQGAEGRVREMAQMIIDKQTKEINDLEGMAKQGNPSQESAAVYQAAETQMHDRMMAAKGADASETWIRKMIEHHRGAVEMSNIVVARSQDAKVREKARKAAADQTREIGELEAMLSGEAAPPAEPAASPAPPAAAPKAKDAPAPKTKVAPRPKAEPKAKEPAPDPHAGHDMNKM